MPVVGPAAATQDVQVLKLTCEVQILGAQLTIYSPSPFAPSPLSSLTPYPSPTRGEGDSLRQFIHSSTDIGESRIQITLNPTCRDS
jgi:hypothetical protein